MKTTTEEVKEMLLSGRHITKLDLFYESEIASSCLPQRIYDIRRETDWDIKSQSVKGKGTLREYWLEPEEIERIKSFQKDQSNEEIQDLVEMASESLDNEDKAYFEEQIGLGLPWQNWG